MIIEHFVLDSEPASDLVAPHPATTCLSIG